MLFYPGGVERQGIEAVILGSGTSVGVPFIGCDCAVCTSPDPRNHRLRSSLLLRSPHARILVDCGPDFRTQALRERIHALDAVILTHEHADHILGLDDLRLLCALAQTPMPVLADRSTLEVVARVFAYAFDGRDTGSSKPRLTLGELDPRAASVTVAGVAIVPVPVQHGQLTVLGLRVGDFAYIPDCNGIGPLARERLAGLDTLVIDGLRHRPHRTHFHTDEVLAVIADLAPRQAWLTHLTHEWDATRDEERLPAGVRLAYDGLVLAV